MRSKGQTKNKNINYLIGSTPSNKQSPKSSFLKQDKTFIKQRERKRERETGTERELKNVIKQSKGIVS